MPLSDAGAIDPHILVRTLIRRCLVVALLGAFAIVATTVARRVRSSHRARPALPVIGAVPALSMRTQRDGMVTNADFHGAVSIVDFFFTSCPISCPRMMARMADLERTLVARGDDKGRVPVRLVSISVDPENDTPPKLEEYGRKYGVEVDRWWLLTGEADALSRIVVDGFKVNYQKADPSIGITEIMHGNWFLLVDDDARIRGYYLSDDPARVAELVEDAEGLAHAAR